MSRRLRSGEVLGAHRVQEVAEVLDGALLAGVLLPRPRRHAGVREHGLSYSVFMDKLMKKKIALNRKTLADLAMNHPDAFKAIVEAVNS